MCVCLTLLLSLSEREIGRHYTQTVRIYAHTLNSTVHGFQSCTGFFLFLCCFVIRLSEFVGHRRRRHSCHLRSLKSSNLNGKYTLRTHVECRSYRLIKVVLIKKLLQMANPNNSNCIAKWKEAMNDVCKRSTNGEKNHDDFFCISITISPFHTSSSSVY